MERIEDRSTERITSAEEDTLRNLTRMYGKRTIIQMILNMPDEKSFEDPEPHNLELAPILSKHLLAKTFQGEE